MDSSTTIATHLNKVLRENAAELLGRDETQQLLDKLAKKTQKLVEDLVPGKIPLGTVTKVLQNLLNESVVIKDMRTIIETLSDECGKTQILKPNFHGSSKVGQNDNTKYSRCRFNLRGHDVRSRTGADIT